MDCKRSWNAIHQSSTHHDMEWRLMLSVTDLLSWLPACWLTDWPAVATKRPQSSRHSFIQEGAVSYSELQPWKVDHKDQLLGFILHASWSWDLTFKAGSHKPTLHFVTLRFEMLQESLASSQIEWTSGGVSFKVLIFLPSGILHHDGFYIIWFGFLKCKTGWLSSFFYTVSPTVKR